MGLRDPHAELLALLMNDGRRRAPAAAGAGSGTAATSLLDSDGADLTVVVVLAVPSRGLAAVVARGLARGLARGFAGTAFGDTGAFVAFYFKRKIEKFAPGAKSNKYEPRNKKRTVLTCELINIFCIISFVSRSSLYFDTIHRAVGECYAVTEQVNTDRRGGGNAENGREPLLLEPLVRDLELGVRVDVPQIKGNLSAATQ